MNVTLWLKGLAAAIIGGASNAVTLYLVDPATFSDWTKLGKLAGISALVSLAMYLKRSPVPNGQAVSPPVEATTTPEPARPWQYPPPPKG